MINSKNIRKKTCNESGITLITLTITIIVVIILAAVSISTLSNKDSVLKNADDAKTQSLLIGIEDTLKIEYKSLVAMGYRNGDSSTLDKAIEKTNSIIEENGCLIEKVTSGGTDQYFANVNGNRYEIDIETLSIDSSAPKVTVPETLQVGDTVTWTPSGQYEWNKEYFSDSDVNMYIVTKMLYSGNSVPSSLGSNDINMTISSWKVLKINDSRTEVTLVPSNPTNGVVTLQGAQGYNNAVDLLNKACESLYGNKQGISAKSISMIDIEELMEETADVISAKQGTPAYLDSYHTGNSTYRSSEEGDSKGAYITNKAYPKIYAEEQYSSITPQPTYSGTRLGTSDSRNLFIARQFASVPKTNSNVTNIHPVRTSYSLNKTKFNAALGSNSELINKNRTYWVATRNISLQEYICEYNVYIVGTTLYYVDLYNSAGSYGSDSYSLFPVVTITAGTISRNRYIIYIYRIHTIKKHNIDDVDQLAILWYINIVTVRLYDNLKEVWLWR